MQEHDQEQDEAPAPPASGDGADRLEHIVDHTEEVGDCRAWIHDQFRKGNDADSIMAELIAGGWPVDDAEAMVEEGRRATRRLRGALTRDDISRIAEAKYRKTFRLAFRIGIAGMIAIGVTYGCYAKTLFRHGTDAAHSSR